jgi:16S rRNA (uracil1498-N3)-methyltransferase
MTRLYVPSPIEEKIYELNAQQSHYLHVVLRKKHGDKIKIFNETDGEWSAIIHSVTKRSISIQIDQFLKPSVKCVERFLAFSLLKNDAMAFLAEKITELGVTHVQPLITDYTQIHKFSLERFQKQMIDAAQQCERFDIPHLYPPKKMDEFLKEIPNNIQFYAALERADDKNLALNKSELLGFIIGPEGGFSPREREIIVNHSRLKIISLGSLVLRAETAAIVCLSKAIF